MDNVQLFCGKVSFSILQILAHFLLENVTSLLVQFYYHECVCKGFLNFTCWTAVLVKQPISSCQWKQTSSGGLWLASLAALMGCQLLQWSNSDPFPWGLNFPVERDAVNCPQIRFQIPSVLKVTSAGSSSVRLPDFFMVSHQTQQVHNSCLLLLHIPDLKTAPEELTSMLWRRNPHSFGVYAEAETLLANAS